MNKKWEEEMIKKMNEAKEENKKKVDITTIDSILNEMYTALRGYEAAIFRLNEASKEVNYRIDTLNQIKKFAKEEEKEIEKEEVEDGANNDNSS